MEVENASGVIAVIIITLSAIGLVLWVLLELGE